ncbi:Isy1-like splicing factor [Clavulina sp. PMI_390]|nr:Isy1-like splicing factor [Clavulina sp. PMI_390]
MARNEEKAQSMLYRFREAKAAEFGVAGRGDKRPRIASTCKSLKDCERWRGEILREISRKVSKIQDTGLSDYEIRDLNDEINKLMREKRHWENQIIALGGANYRRNIAMLDSEGKEVPGTKGYKYFGRAKDLPGVKELFQKSTEVDEETIASQHYKKYQNQGASYYGDLDEADDDLLNYEVEQENDEWDAAYVALAKTLGLDASLSSPPIPRPPPTAIGKTLGDPTNGDTDMEGKRTESDAKKAAESESAQLHVITKLPPLLSVLQPSDITPPTLPTKAEMEDVLLELRKRALLEEYVG